MVRVLLLPAPTLKEGQLTVRVSKSYEPLLLALTKSTPAGNTSVKAMLLTELPPVLRTVMVYTTV